MTRRRVVITGMGTVNPLAHDVESTWEAIKAGRSGIGPIDLFDASTFPSAFCGQVRDYDFAAQVPNAARHEHAGRHGRFALGAAVQAWRQAGLAGHEALSPQRLGVYLGSGEGQLDFDSFTSLLVDAWTDRGVDVPRWAELAFERMDMWREVEQESNMVLAHLAAEFGARGPAFNVLTACAASTQAMGVRVPETLSAQIEVHLLRLGAGREAALFEGRGRYGGLEVVGELDRLAKRRPTP